MGSSMTSLKRAWVSNWKTVASGCLRVRLAASDARRVFHSETAWGGTGWPHLREKGIRLRGGMLRTRKLRAPVM